MRALLIGGSGLVGPHVGRALSRTDDVNLACLTRSGRTPLCATDFKADRRDASALAAALSAWRPDVVVDMIPFSVEDAVVTADALAASAPPARLIAVSSIDVYLAYGRLSGTEDAPPQPTPLSETAALRTRYGPEAAAYDKIGVERVYRERIETVAALRLPAVYGWPDADRIAEPLDKMLAGETRLEIDARWADWQFSRCLHANAGRAIALAARAAFDGRLAGFEAFNVAEEGAHTLEGWWRRIGEAAGWRGEIVRVGAPDPEPPQDFVVCSRKIRDRLGFAEAVDPAQGLADAVAWRADRRLGRVYAKTY